MVVAVPMALKLFAFVAAHRSTTVVTASQVFVHLRWGFCERVTRRTATVAVTMLDC